MRDETLPENQLFQCLYAEECGGCNLTGFPYRDQLAIKQARVEKLLKPFGRVEPIRGMDNPFHYRNKVHAVFVRGPHGRILSGVYRQGTHEVVPVEHCLIEDERADAVIASVRRLAQSFGYQPFDEDRRSGFLRHAVVRAGRNELMLILVTANAEFPSRNAFIRALVQAHPEITTVVQNLNDRKTSMVLGKRDFTLYGKGYIEDTLCGLTFRLSPQSFYQVNTLQAETLYRIAGEMADCAGTETVLDAYCGVGTIGLTMADHFARLIGVELNPEAVRDALGNARRNGIQNARFYCDDAGRFIRRCAAQRMLIDTVLMDPPRSGSDEVFLASLLQLQPRRVVYISCEPTTLARDLAYLVRGGYKMRRAVPVDMFPATEHVETCVLLSHKNPQTSPPSL